MTKKASPALERFIDETIRRARSAGYYPTVFESMRSDWGTWEAMKRIVISGEIQSGFRRLVALNLKEWTVEAGVVQFASEFDRETVEAAAWRLNQAERRT